MILFIFEGKDDEPRLYKTLKKVFQFKLREEELLYYYCNNIFSLVDIFKSYSESELDDSIDIVNVLKEDALIHKKHNSDLDKIKYSKDVSEIFLFFDYDLKSIDNKNFLSIEEQNQKILSLFNYFENGSLNSFRNGIKLYINYPMIESYRYFKKILPDDDYENYSVDALIDGAFKEKVNDESYYKNLKYLCFDLNKSGELKTSEDKKREYLIKQNWNYIIEMNIKKANYICTNNYTIPKEKRIISQQSVFNNQIIKYIKPKKEIAILNSFPLFLFEYFAEL